jgi:hypothetical protein
VERDLRIWGRRIRRMWSADCGMEIHGLEVRKWGLVVREKNQKQVFGEMRK